MKNKFNFKNLSKEDKDKYMFLGGLGLIGGILFGVLYFTTGEDEKKESDDFSNPQADLIEYNSKLDAVTGKKTPQNVKDLEHAFSNPNISEKEEDIVPNFEALDKQLAQIGNSGQQEQPLRPANNVATNNHDVYGDYNMWQTSEPQKSNIGYSNTQNRPRVVKSKEIVTPKYEEEDVEVVTETKQKIVQHTKPNLPKKEMSDVEKTRLMRRTGMRDVSNTPNIKINIDTDQTVKNGGNVRLKAMQNCIINGHYVPMYSTFYGRVTFAEDRVHIAVNSIQVDGKIVQCNLVGYGLDGLQGIGVNVASLSATSQSAKNELERVVNINRTAVGRVVSSLFSSNKREDIRVKLLNNHSLIFTQNQNL